MSDCWVRVAGLWCWRGGAQIPAKPSKFRNIIDFSAKSLLILRLMQGLRLQRSTIPLRVLRPSDSVRRRQQSRCAPSRGRHRVLGPPAECIAAGRAHWARRRGTAVAAACGPPIQGVCVWQARSGQALGQVGEQKRRASAGPAHRRAERLRGCEHACWCWPPRVLTRPPPPARPAGSATLERAARQVRTLRAGFDMPRFPSASRQLRHSTIEAVRRRVPPKHHWRSRKRNRLAAFTACSLIAHLIDAHAYAM
jgi:hypothetical protein